MSPRVSRAGGGLVAAAGLVAVITLAARFVGFGRWLVFSGQVGAGCVGEAYSTANILPNVLFEVAAGGALAAVAVPLVAGALARGERAEADATASALLTWAVTVLLPLSVILAALSGPLIRAIYGGDTAGCEGGTALAAGMLVVFAPQVVLYGVGIVLAGVLQAHRRFLAAAMAPLLSSVVVIAAYLGYGRLAPSGAPAASSLATAVLAGGTTLGVAALSLPLLVPAARAGIALRPTWRFPRGIAAGARRLALAGVVALVAQQLAVLVTFAVMHAHSSAGTVNVYQYVQAVYLLPYAVLAVPIATAAFPALAAAEHAPDPDAPDPNGSDAAVPDVTGSGVPDVPDVTGSGVSGVSYSGATAATRASATEASAGTLAAAMRAVVLAGAFGAGVLVATAGPAGDFFGALDAGRGRGAADPGAGEQSLESMTAALVAFAPGLVGFAVAALLTRALYVRGRPVPAGAAVAGGWVVAALVPLLVLRGNAGPRVTLTVLGLGSSVGMTLAALALSLAVARAWGPSALSGVLRSLTAGAIGGVVAGTAGWLAGGVSGRALAGPVPQEGILAPAICGMVSAAVAVAAFALVAAAVDRPTAAALRTRLRHRLRHRSRS